MLHTISTCHRLCAEQQAKSWRLLLFLLAGAIAYPSFVHKQTLAICSVLYTADVHLPRNRRLDQGLGCWRLWDPAEHQLGIQMDVHWQSTRNRFVELSVLLLLGQQYQTLQLYC